MLIKCDLCGVLCDGNTFRFTNQPDKPVHKDAVYTRVCKSAIEAQKIREAEGEDDLEPIALGLCINPDGVYNSRYRWIARPTEKI